MPGAPVVVPGSITMDLQIDTAGNPPSIEYAIYDAGVSQYVGADGSLGAAPAWKTENDWYGGGDVLKITGALPKTVHYLKVKARVPLQTETAFGPSTAVMTLSSDAIPPNPDPAELADKPVPTQPHGFRATAVVATDDTGPVEYRFAAQTAESIVPTSSWQLSNIYEPAGLTPGGKYTVTVRARDSSESPPPGQNTTAVSDPQEVWVFAEAPGAPNVSDLGASSVTLSFDEKTNSSTVLYSIFESRTGRYVNASGILVLYVPAWRSKADWGASFTVSGLQGGSLYYFSARARNGIGAMTQRSPEAEILTVFSFDPPGAPTVPAGYLGSRSLKLQLDPGSYDNATTFLIMVTGDATSRYVQPDGTLAATETWQTLAQWGDLVFVRSLLADTSYVFKVQAKLDEAFSDWGATTDVLTNISGDCDASDSVNIVDMVYVRNNLNKVPASDDNFLADVNDDGLINIVDMVHVRNRLNDVR